MTALLLIGSSAYALTIGGAAWHFVFRKLLT